MIPCRVCEKDASTGWVKGFAPAPDSLKMALCREHDTPENRAAVTRSWHEAQVRALSRSTAVAAHRAGDVPLMVQVRFSAGGMLTFTSRACFPTEQKTLCLEGLDGSRTYIPLEHIREYTVRPLREGI